jgi:hypothetical protein
MNKYYLIDNQYFPILTWFNPLYLNGHIIISSFEPYPKMTFRNRAVVAGSNGLVNLSVPLIKGRNQKTSFREVRICNDEKWQMNHWRTLTSCYNKSPYFEFYKESVEKFFARQHEFLFDLNLTILHWLKEVLKFPAELKIAGEVSGDFSKGEVIDLTTRWLPKNFQKEPSGIIYPQVFEDRIGFQSNLSILDMLFNIGPQAGSLLFKSFQDS